MIDNHEVRQSIVHFVHRFLIETGRWNKINNNFLKSTMCDCNNTGDEFHYVLECTHFSNDKKVFFVQVKI